MELMNMITHFDDKQMEFAKTMSFLADEIARHPAIRTSYSPITLAIVDSLLALRASRAARD
jgi:pterin-4a-carbinolamine dehydratase